MEEKTIKIKKSISENGFENTALIFSLADTSKEGGKLGWINENSLSENIKLKLKKIKVGETTDPIMAVSNHIILKINDIKIQDKKVDINEELQKFVEVEKNNQLNQLANIYFKKIKKNYIINEY